MGADWLFSSMLEWAEGECTDMAFTGSEEWFSTLITLLISYGIPLAIAVWVIVTLIRVRSGLEALQKRVESIEKQLIIGK